jgi:hypothetical protein
MKEEMARGSILREHEVERQEYFRPLRKKKRSLQQKRKRGQSKCIPFCLRGKGEAVQSISKLERASYILNHWKHQIVGLGPRDDDPHLEWFLLKFNQTLYRLQQKSASRFDLSFLNKALLGPSLMHRLCSCGSLYSKGAELSTLSIDHTADIPKPFII